jgi:hypothetical protein
LVTSGTAENGEGFQFYWRTSIRHHSTFDVFQLIEAATKDLASNEPEQFKTFLLAAIAGLRRREIDTLEWCSFRWDEKARGVTS